jgi:SAM-dependent methyltransferase
MYPSQIALLRSPVTGGALQVQGAECLAGRIKSGVLVDSEGNSFHIREYIPRFVDADNYCRSFTVQWDKYPLARDLYDSYAERFAKETRWAGNLSGETILEAGCGIGAFTRSALRTGATLVSFDLSTGVDQAYRENAPDPRHLVVQASLFAMPFCQASFDKVFCFGVLQHTPEPQRAFSELVKFLKPGGWIAADIYAKPPPKGHPYAGLLRSKYLARRLTTGRDPEALHKVVKAYVWAIWPLTSMLGRSQWGRQVNRRFLIDDYRPRLPAMDPSHYRDFAVLDIFDMLSPAYDYPMNIDEFRAWYVGAGLAEIDVHAGYNGLEGRGRKPGMSAVTTPIPAG